MEQYIGKMLDNRYELLEVIGTGGMAVVYQAKCHRLNRLVAVKVLKSDFAEDDDFRRRFHAESKAVAMLSHPNIVAVYDVSQSEELDYIVMELIDGITLKQYMERRGGLKWQEALHFITQILRGLRHAHSRGIIHRDIKPQNIMILRDGSVKVADFGIACLSDSNQTLMQEALGSVHYISPEQARGDRIDERSDLYSAGVVLYEMLTGCLPFEGESAVAVAIQHLSAIPLSPRDRNENVPPALELICMKAMSPDLGKRYPNADAMLRDLDMFRSDPEKELSFTVDDLMPPQKIETPEPTVMVRPYSETARHGERMEKQMHSVRKRILLGLISVAVLLGIVGLWRFIWGSFEQKEPTEFSVPKVIGLTVEEAQRLEEVDGIFEIVVEGQRTSAEYPEGVILSQDPTEGTIKKSNLILHVYVSRGVESEKMPELNGEDFRTAKITLNSFGLALTVQPKEEYSEEVNAGYVIRTEPMAGEELRSGDTVTLVVSLGRETKPVKVPSFVGLPYDTVEGQLETLHLVGEMVYVDSSEPAGRVVRQSVSPNTEVEEGSTVSFEVSLGPVNAVEQRTYVLPEGEDGETVQVRILQDGVVLFDDTVEKSLGSIRQSYTESGTVSVYFDGELVQREVIVIA